MFSAGLKSKLNTFKSITRIILNSSLLSLLSFSLVLAQSSNGMPLYARQHLDFTAVVGLAFVLAMGFLLVILSCALWANWLPLLVGEHGGCCQVNCKTTELQADLLELGVDLGE
jgi:hypothetical protein